MPISGSCLLSAAPNQHNSRKGMVIIMKRRDIDKALKKAGWTITSGGNHDLATHPGKPGIKITLPRHNEVNEYTAKGILEDAGLK